MVMLSIKIQSDLVRQGLQDLEAEIPQIGRRKIYDMMNRITRRMEEYPPERPGQRYKRTGRFYASWNVKPLEKGYTVTSSAPYAHFVVGDAYGLRQAWMHKGRWQVLRDVVEDEVSQLPPVVEQEIVMVARRIGFDATVGR